MPRYAILTEVETDEPQDEYMQIEELLKHAAKLAILNKVSDFGFANLAMKIYQFTKQGEKNA